MKGALQRIGRGAVRVARGAGSFGLVALRILLALPRLDLRETLRATVVHGNRSLPIALAVAVFAGAILVVQTTFYVKKIGAREILGWAAGFAILREFGPLLTAMVLSGRVGARNAAEVAALAVGEQLDALEAMGVDLWRTILAPRAVACAAALLLLTTIADLVAIGSATLFAWGTLQVRPDTFLRSVELSLGGADLAAGLLKAAAYGLAIALVSTREGLRARGGGATSVGRAATRSVVKSSFAILLLDVVLTQVGP